MRNICIVIGQCIFNYSAFIMMSVLSLNIYSPWFALTVLPLVYLVIGYYGVDLRGSRIERLINVSIISLVGLVVWGVFFYLYMNGVFDGDIERSQLFLSAPELYWIYYGMYNLFALPAIFMSIAVLGYPPNKYIFSLIMLLLNFCPMLFMWVGLMIRQFINKRQKPQNP